MNLDKMLSIMKRLEWSSGYISASGYYHQRCPICKGPLHIGHHQDCEMVSLINELEATKQGKQ
jgi:hypothetical protein